MAKSKLNENLRQAMVKLLNVNSLRLFGLMIYNFDYVEFQDHPVYKTMFVSFDEHCNSWKMGYDKDFVDSQKPEELVYIISHEILHAINGHCFRIADRDFSMWNMACDHVINSSLDKDIDSGNLNMAKPKDRFFIPFLVKRHFAWSTERVYSWLMKNAKCKPVVDENGDDIFGISEVFLPGAGENRKDFTVKFNVDMEVFNKNAKTIAAQNNLIAQVRAHINSVAQGRGLIPGNVYNILKHLIDVSIPPEELLEVAIKNILVESDTRSWRSINKRLYAHGIMSCANEYEELLGDVICLIDHSGSISDEDAMKFGGAIKNCSSLFQNLHLLYHDTKQQGDVKVMSSEEVVRTKKLFKLYGRGGTCHDEAFNYVQECYDRGVNISVVLVFTDWESNIEEIWDRYSWHQEVPMFSVVPHKKHINEKFGRTCILH